MKKFKTLAVALGITCIATTAVAANKDWKLGTSYNPDVDTAKIVNNTNERVLLLVCSDDNANEYYNSSLPGNEQKGLSGLIEDSGTYLFYILENNKPNGLSCSTVNSLIASGDATLYKKKKVTFDNNVIDAHSVQFKNPHYDSGDPLFRVKNKGSSVVYVDSSELNFKCEKLRHRDSGGTVSNSRAMISYDGDAKAGTDFTVNLYSEDSCTQLKDSYTGTLPPNKLVIKYS